MTVLDGEIVRGDMFYDIPGASVAMNVFHWVLDGGSISDAALVAAIDTWATTTWGEPWADLANAGCTLLRVELKKVTAFGVVVAGLGTATIAQVGDATNQVMPAAVSGYLQTDLAGTTRKGRKFVPGLDEDNITNGILTAPALGLLVDLLEAWQTRIAVDGSNDLIPCILSLATGTVRITTFDGFVTDVPAYQRRRKPGVGI